MILQEIIKQNYYLRTCSAYIYNLLFSPISFFKIGITNSGVFLKNSKSKIIGKNNSIKIGINSRLINCKIFISGINNSISIEEHCFLQDLTLWIEGDNNTIRIERDSSFYGGQFAALEGTSITIGPECLFSYGIAIRTSDSHKIYNTQDERINTAQSIEIENHVWLGANVAILKGVQIAHDSIVGYGSIVTKSLLSPNSIYAGSPAKLIKTDISWKG